MSEEDDEYTAHLRQLPCCLKGHGKCWGPVCVHHTPGRKGMSQKNHDHTGKPICAGHHTERHSLTGFFRKHTKAELREWEERESARYRGEYLGLGASAPVQR